MKERLMDKNFETMIGHPLDITSVSDDFNEALKRVQSLHTDKLEDVQDMKQQIAVTKSEATAASKLLAEAERKKRKILRETSVFESVVSSMELLQDCKNLTDALSVLSDREKKLNQFITTFKSGADMTEFLETKNMEDKCCVACGRTCVIHSFICVTLCYPLIYLCYPLIYCVTHSFIVLPTHLYIQHQHTHTHTGSMNTKQIREMQIALSKLRDMLQQDEKREEYVLFERIVREC